MSHDTTLSKHENKLPGRAPDKHDAEGGELGDPTPLEPPLGHRRSLSLAEQIGQQVRIAQLKILEDSMSPETEEEADDFEVGEDYEPLSRYENDHMPTLANLKKRAKEINDQITKVQLKHRIAEHKKRIRENTPQEEGAVPPPPSLPEENTSD